MSLSLQYQLWFWNLVCNLRTIPHKWKNYIGEKSWVSVTQGVGGIGDADFLAKMQVMITMLQWHDKFRCSRLAPLACSRIHIWGRGFWGWLSYRQCTKYREIVMEVLWTRWIYWKHSVYHQYYRRKSILELDGKSNILSNFWKGNSRKVDASWANFSYKKVPGIPLACCGNNSLVILFHIYALARMKMLCSGHSY